MFERLNDRERELLVLLLQGQTFQGISEWLCIDYVSYVKNKRSLLRKLGVKRITELLYRVIENGLLEEYL